MLKNTIDIIFNPPKLKKELKLRKRLTGSHFNLSPIIVIDEISSGKYIVEANTQIFPSSIETVIKI